MQTDSRPIGVFDSGLGGLTVLRSLVAELPQENFLYLGDTARLPYGTKSPESIRNYCRQNVEFLLKRGVKAVVVACNTASTQCRSDRLGLTPVYNVIDPGAAAALVKTRNKRIGVLGTRATVQSQCYPEAMKSLAPDVQVFSQACPLLVPLAEEGWIDDPITNLIAYRYIQPVLANDIDTLILGCTHYPILHQAIHKVAGSAIALVDSGAAIAAALLRDLKEQRLHPAGQKSAGTLELLVTDLSDHLLRQALSIAAPCAFAKVEKVDL